MDIVHVEVVGRVRFELLDVAKPSASWSGEPGRYTQVGCGLPERANTVELALTALGYNAVRQPGTETYVLVRGSWVSRAAMMAVWAVAAGLVGLEAVRGACEEVQALERHPSWDAELFRRCPECGGPLPPFPAARLCRVCAHAWSVGVVGVPRQMDDPALPPSQRVPFA